MRIGTCDIRLPCEDPLLFDLDWRHKVVAALPTVAKRERLPELLRQDRDILLWRQAQSTRNRKSTRPLELCKMVAGWHAQPALAALLQALLLTEASYAQVASELGGVDPEAVRLYGAMFFDVRDSAGKVKDCIALRARLAQDQRVGDNAPPELLWHRAAMNGHDMLAALLGSPKASCGVKTLEDSVDQMVQQELLRRVLARQIGTRDLLLMRQMRMTIQESKARLAKDQGDDKGGWDLLRDIFTHVVPSLKTMVDEAEQQKQQGVASACHAVEQQIAAVPIQDLGMRGMIPGQGGNGLRGFPAPPPAMPPTQPAAGGIGAARGRTARAVTRGA